MASRQGTKLKDHKVLALDIGSRFIKAAELRLARGTISLLNVVVCPTPPDTFDKSQILDPTTLGTAINQLLKENKISTRKVVLSVRSQTSVVVRPIEIPKVSKKELAETVKFEIERHVPFSAEEIVMDYAPYVDPDEIPETEENMKVLLAVAQEELVTAYLKMLKAAKLTPIALDVEILAAIRSLVDIHQIDGSNEQAVVLVNIGAASTDISILAQGNLVFNRSVPIAGDTLTNAISEQLGRTFEEAEELKKEHGQIFLDATVGELPAPDADAEQAEPAAMAQSEAPIFNPFGSDAAQEETIAWNSESQQVFSLDDDTATPATTDASPKTLFGEDFFTKETPPIEQSEPASAADDDNPFFRFVSDEEDAQTTVSAEPSAAATGAVFDLSSELEGQLPPQRPRPAVNENTDEESSFFQAPAAATVEEQAAQSVADTQAEAGAEPMAAPAVGGPSDVTFASSDDFTRVIPPIEQTNQPVNEVFQRRVFDSMQPTLMELVTEIRRSLEFYSSRDTDNPVERVLIYGGTSRLPRLAEFIHQEIGLDVLHANPLEMIDTSTCRLPADYLQDLAPALPVCIGLGLRDMLA